METVTENLVSNDTKKSQEPLRFDIYNQLYDTQYVDVFAKEHKQHTGVISDKNPEYSADDMAVLMKFHSDEKSILFNSVKLKSKKEEERIIPLVYWFNINQFQSTIINIPIELTLDEPVLEFEVTPKTNSIVTLFRNDFTSTNSLEYLGKYPKDMVCLIIENTSSEFYKGVDIFNIPKSNTFIKVKSPLCSYEDVQESVNEKSIVFKNLKIVSKNSTQMCMPIYMRNLIDKSVKENHVVNYFSAMQFQSSVIDVDNIELPIDKDHAYTFDIHPYSKVMLFFYND